MYKVLIAMPQGYLADCLLEEFSQEYSSFICHRGDDLPSLLSSLRPDILIVHLSLPHTDGLTALLQSSYKPPVILALTVYWNQQVEAVAKIADIDRALMLPRPIDFILSQAQLLINEKLSKKAPSPDH